ncbi:PREDICTED: uncharacterized protein LOC109164092 [Ipomoea nil]|uniref:uncharacterized protein LOC109164092 n=1 Tax=Ipomoea nil TaxID=35883 RepID=UPI000901CA75|nr:PREDICTED: uncharacterized protein LOC109164092 [Ipomoea nil]
MLANRLKETLQSVVSVSQSTFVPHRLLTDNIIVAGEVGHYLRRKVSRAVGWTALKLDMAKAYDRMGWGFLEEMLAALGFDRGWTIFKSTAEARGDIHGIRITRGAPSVSHLFFADDSLLFFKATQVEAQRVKECLEVYSAASEQVINYEKSNAMFSSNTASGTRIVVTECVGIQETTDLGRYLGLPSVLGRNKSASFWYIEQKAKYYPHCDFLEAQLGGNPSYLWRSILAGQSLLQLGAARRIGNGKDSRIWGWPWLADACSSTLDTPCIEELREAKVDGLINDHGSWDEDILHDLFNDTDVPRILATPLSPLYPDSWWWKGDSRGMYTVRHGYKLLTEAITSDGPGDSFTVWTRLWGLPMPPKAKNLLWRCARGILPVKDILKLRSSGNKVPEASVSSHWSPPPQTWVKCNVDAALFGNGAGYGVVVRNHGGRFVAAPSGKMGSVRDPLMAEAVAVERTFV